MEVELEPPTAEIKRLRRCINDLVSVLALPAIWSGGEPSQIVRTLVDALLGMLRLDLVYVRLKDPIGLAPIEMVRIVQSRELTAQAQEIGELLNHWFGADPQKWPALVRKPIGDADMSIVPLRLGLQSEIGVIVAGSQRADFPGQTERLLLSVAANQAVIGLQEARLLSDQKRIANELDRRVAQRTDELAAANEQLRKEIAERRLAEERLKQEERELRRSEAFLAEAQRVSSTGSFSWRVATDEITWSEQLYRIFEFNPAVPVTLELIGSRVHPDDLPFMHETIDRARGDGSDFEYEQRLQMPDRSVKYLHLVARGTRDRDGQLEFIGAIQDVTERRLAEEALNKARNELAHVARIMTLGALTASIAHEVNQPLAGIITNAGTCLRMLAADPPNLDGARATAQRTLRDGNRASEVIQRLRAMFARKPPAIEPVDLNQAAREVLALCSRELQGSRVVLRTDFSEGLPAVSGDRVQLQQVILNLIVNAADAMRAIGDRPRHLRVATTREGADRVRLSVRDSGAGIDPQNLEKLFDAFYTTKSHGMGVGLSISRTIIEGHGGRLWASANDGPGATFSFTIPAQHVAGGT